MCIRTANVSERSGISTFVQSGIYNYTIDEWALAGRSLTFAVLIPIAIINILKK